MAGWSPAILAIASCILFSIQHSQACSVVCPPNEKICTCPDGKPKPTPDPSGFVAIDSCGGLIHYCSVGGECKPEENGCPADCPQLCTMDYSPVCGTDGKTYSNKCALEVAACKTRKTDLAVASQGECEVCPLCATLYSPVCGSDGNTYSSKCALDSKACREKIELTVSYSGKCDKQCSPFCTFEYDPICGTDGQTYSNKCALESKACMERSNLAEAYAGECEAPNAPGRVPILGPGALPPAWTQVENSDTCLKKYKPSTPQDALHFEVCVPLSKPDECSQPTWWELATALEVVPKEELVSAKPPLYLQIEGVRDCLDSYQFEGTSHKEACLPAMRPKNLCNPDSWDQLLQVWDGLKCPKAEVQPLGVNRVAPKYQQIDGWERCVFTQQSGQAKTFCIRNYRPQLCSHAAWNKIKVSNLPSCASTPRIIAAPNAVAPAYLSIEGHEKCLNSHSNGQYNVKCLPKSKPSNCSDEIWERVKDSFTGIPCPDTIKALGVGGLPPAYLRVDGHQACLENFEASSTHKELCLPASRPSGCKQDSWKQLKNDGVFKGIQCPLTGLPPMYLSVEGYKKCLSVFQATSNSQGLCMPDSKPRRCREKAWEQLQDYYHGVRCPITTNIGGVGAPQYLSVDGHSECLDEENEGGFQTVCLPGTKPADCQDEAYDKLSQVTDGLPTCKAQVKILNAVPPAYLSINGHEDCLGSSTSNDGGHQEVCLPREQPVNCSRVAWIGLQNKFEGKDCEPVVRLLGALPPKYLSVDGHKDCLSQQNFSPNGHIELCLPSSKPDSCSADSWKELSEGGKFSGRQCRSTQIIGIAAPLYTQVPGYEKCLESEQSLVGTHEELCLPVTKPFSCAQKAWNKLQQVFIGKDCGSEQQPKLGDQSSDRIVFVGGQSGLPPKYLSVDGHSDCLSSHSPSSGSHSEVCLPSAKPSSCTENSWNALKKQVKAGDLSKCRTQMVLGGLGALPPKYLSIDGHQDCLDQHSPRGASHTEICLPDSKPPACSSDSWDKLKLEVEEQRIEKCAPKIVLGGIGALPPKYLSVTGHKECLSSHTPFRGATHTSVCLPSGRPSSCLEDSWDQLKVEVQEGRIDKCKPQMVGGQFGLPPSYLGIDGHEKCLSSHSSDSSGSHNEVCVPKAKPQPCTVEAWDKLKDEVAQGKLDQCREPSLGLPPPLGSHPSSLPPKYLSVEGWNDCTRGFQASESHTEHCLPLSQPSAPCTSQSYQELMQITFQVDDESTNSRSGDILDAQPPEYLFVADHAKCLDEINVGSHVEKCMPSNRPNGCSSATWVQLQNVFEGQNCKACQKFCVRNYDPVCGSDGVTYSNKCNLEYTGCKEGREVTVQKFGKCCPEICTEDYTPVCGSDGVTYSNRCNLEMAVCSKGDDSLSFSHAGECKTVNARMVGDSSSGMQTSDSNGAGNQIINQEVQTLLSTLFLMISFRMMQ